MFFKICSIRRALLSLVMVAAALVPRAVTAASCKTQSQMTAAERDALSSAARALGSEVRNGDVQAVQANTIPAVAADFGGIAGSIGNLKPLVQQATITIDNLFLLDASGEAPGSARTDFFCGSPVVVMNLTDLPPGSYALAILHATGVPKPQQISLILAATPDHRWMLGGFFVKPMTQAGHDGLWYWTSARNYAQKNMNWDAWFYYRIAAESLDPVDFLSSPNLDKLQAEEDKVKPDNFPGAKPLTVDAQGSSFQVTSIDTTTTFGPLDLEIHYTPDAAQAAQLHDPPSARKQVTELMTALLAQHPDLPDAFHGIWVQADGGSASLFSLELPMNQIIADGKLPVKASGSQTQ